MSRLHCKESIRDAFISGLQPSLIRQRLLENKTLHLKTMFDQARSLESAMKSSESYAVPNTLVNAAVPARSAKRVDGLEANTLAAAVTETTSLSCYFCGNNRHPRSQCPAKDATCAKCQKKGHYAKVCQSKAASKVSAGMHSPIIATTQSSGSLSKSTATNNIGKLQALFYSGSTESFIHPNFVRRTGLTVRPAGGAVSMASTALSANVTGTCTTNLEYQNQKYTNVHLSVLPGLWADLILGLNFQSQHESITFQYGGSDPPLSVCGFSTLNMDPAVPLANLKTVTLW